ncbi:hypothetical protein HQ571_01430 [Candidatus Kuenenbacteria bacterium]|nr:hypothetical protein [Candidatus Kuenenbacteria bacterium]
MQNHEDLAQILFQKICQILKVKGLKLKIMARKGSKSNKRYTLGYINLQTKTVVLDIYTPKTMKPKSLNGLIRTVAHEVAHLQKPPYRQRYQGRWIARQHYPEFYEQVDKNIEKIKKDPVLGMHFRDI